MLGGMRKVKDQEEKNSHLNRGVELLLRYQEKKKPEQKIFGFRFNRVILNRRIHFEFMITKPKCSWEKNRCLD